MISIAFCAESHAYMNPRPVKTPLLSGKALGDAQRFWDASLEDRNRAQGLLNLTGGVAFPTPALTIFERGMTGTYTVPAGVATTIGREDNMTAPTGSPTAGQALNDESRSMAAAGYIFLSVAGGNQSLHDRVLVFYGENHSDLLNHLEYFASHTSIDWVAKRPRSYLIIPSQAR